MRRLYFAVLSCLFSLQGSYANQKRFLPAYNISPLLEWKSGYFFFVDLTMRKIYDHGGLDLQISGFYPLIVWAERYALGVYGSVEYIHRSGRALTSGETTSIWELPVNVGLKQVIGIIPSIQYYFALGPRYFHVSQHNNSSFVNRHNIRNAVGLFVNTGFNFIPIPHFLIDLFGEYSYGTGSFPSSRPGVYGVTKQIGGFSFGGGIGYNF